MIHSILILVHIAAGSAALLIGTTALSVSKGSDQHRSTGLAFVVAGRIVVVSALISAIWAGVSIDSFLGAEAIQRSDIDDVRRSLRLLMAFLAVLAVLSALDMESALEAVGRGDQRVIRVLGVMSLGSGLLAAAWGALSIGSSATALAWVAVVIGLIGIDEGRKRVRGSAQTDEPIIAHVRGMIGALGGFFAAFAVFGSGRLFELDILDGSAGVIFAALVVILVSQILIRWWCDRVRSGSHASLPQL